jgi:hypothetical protein
MPLLFQSELDLRFSSDRLPGLRTRLRPPMPGPPKAPR